MKENKCILGLEVLDERNSKILGTKKFSKWVEEVVINYKGFTI